MLPQSSALPLPADASGSRGGGHGWLARAAKASMRSSAACGTWGQRKSGLDGLYVTKQLSTLFGKLAWQAAEELW